jgi:glutamyl-tRNA synthetase
MVKEEERAGGLEALAEKSALLNATKHGGRADPGAVIGRMMAESPELRARAKEVSAAARAAAAKVNAMSAADQESLLAGAYGGAEEEKEKQGRVGLPDLPGAERGRVVLRLPPEPSGFMHVGHAMAFTVNYLYKEKYEGGLWLRFEDTNPKKVAAKYYESFRRGLEWLGIKWDREKSISQELNLIYPYGEALISKGEAYACSCDAETVKKLRFEGRPCPHRERPPSESLALWREMMAKKHPEGSYVIRFKGDMSSLDYSLRDPNIFRIIDRSHPLTGREFSLWPTYDLANTVEDELCGVTHILRSSEFHTALQELIRERLSFRRVEVIQFSRYNFKGTPVSKRLLRPLVEEGKVSGWDDLRMPTVDSVRRRGIIPEAIRQFTLQVGYTRSEKEFDWSLLYAVNRKLLDPVTKRLFFVPRPASLQVEGAPKRTLSVRFHPDKELGERSMEADGSFMVPSSDLDGMKEGQVFRLMDLFNVKLTSGGSKARGEYAGDEVLAGTRKLQWVSSGAVPVRVLEPGPLFDDEGVFDEDSLRQEEGFAEPAFAKLQAGEIIQFPRFGFCRVDSPGVCVLAHK